MITMNKCKYWPQQEAVSTRFSAHSWRRSLTDQADVFGQLQRENPKKKEEVKEIQETSNRKD